MRSLTRFGHLLATGLLLASPATTFGQNTHAYESRVDSLARVWRAAEARRVSGEGRARSLRPPSDTMAVGPLRLVVADPRLVPLARFAAESALGRLRFGYGRALDVLAAYPMLFREDSARGRRWLTILAFDRAGRQVAVNDVGVDSVAVAVTLRNAALDALAIDADTAFVLWFRGRLPVDSVMSEEWKRVRLELLASPARVARRCYDGNTSDCQIALALIPVPDPATQWFDSAGRHQFVSGGGDFGRRFRRVDANKCLAGNDSTCIALIRSYPVNGLPDPVTVARRHSVAQLAAMVGGAGSMERMLLTPGTPGDRIAAAAGIPIDSLLRLWVARAQHSTLASQDMSAAIAGASLVWIALCAGLALRSSRWR